MDERALEWKILLPNPARFTTHGAPECVRDVLEMREFESGSPRILVIWEGRTLALPDIQPFENVVLVNPTNVQMSDLQACGFARVLRYAAVPRLDDVHWFIPLETGRVASGAFALYSPYKSAAKVKTTLVRQLARRGWRGWYGDEIWIAQRQDSPLQELARTVLGLNQPHLMISTGTPCPVRKPTVGVLDGSGTLRGIIKVAETPATKRLVSNEAAIIRTLAGVPPVTGNVPRLLADQIVGSVQVVVQSVLNGKPSGADFEPAHARFLRMLETGSTAPLESSAPIRAIEQGMNDLSETSLDRVNRALTAIRSLAGGKQVPVTINHGDFAPWNLRGGKAGVRAFDWEYGYSNGLPLMDELHYRIQSAFLLRDKTIREVGAMLQDRRISRHGDLGGPMVSALHLTFLAHTIVQRHCLGYPISDLQVMRASDLLDDALERIEPLAC